MSACRSVLFLPASNPRAIAKARGLDCDVAILDLEDAVAPSAKAEARQAAVAAVSDGGFGPRLGVRVNGLDTPWGADDLTAVAGARPSLVVAPKVEDAASVGRLSAALPPDCDLWAMIETPAGLMNLGAIASAGGTLGGLMLGVNDLSIALGTGAAQDREPLKPWLALTVAAARANGLLALDGVFNRFRELDGFRAEADQARLFGFDGKSLIHPDQIAPCHAAFAPTADEIERAHAVVAAFDGQDARGAVAVDGDMVERLHLDAARRLLARTARA